MLHVLKITDPIIHRQPSISMKFIHTADWHLGHTLYQHPRTEEFAAFFDALRSTIADEKPDALLVAGDIFDTSMPTVEAQEFYYSTVVSLHEVRPAMKIIIIAGNHDSASRLEAPNRLWEALNVTVVGHFERREQDFPYEKHILPIENEVGTMAYVAALPHTYVGNLPHAAEGEDSYQTRVLQLFRTLREEIDRRCAGVKIPVLAIAHLSAVFHPERVAMEGIGGKEVIDLASLSALFDYVALGHIHQPGHCREGVNALYAGAPIPITFDETYPHGVVVGEFVSDGVLTLRRIDYPTLIPLCRIPAEPAPAEVALQALADFPADCRAYVQAQIFQTGPAVPDLKERIRQSLQDKQAIFCDIKYTYPDTQDEGRCLQVRNVAELRAIDPLTLAKSYYEERTGTSMTDEQLALFNQVVDEIRQ